MQNCPPKRFGLSWIVANHRLVYFSSDFHIISLRGIGNSSFANHSPPLYPFAPYIHQSSHRHTRKHLPKRLQLYWILDNRRSVLVTAKTALTSVLEYNSTAHERRAFRGE